MIVTILKEAGYEEALLGISLSYNTSIERAAQVAPRLAPKNGGHNKFLESIIVWLDITAPRYWWSQFDTYRVGITKQSESTMHTLLKATVTQENFSGHVPAETLQTLNHFIESKQLDLAKGLLPEGFLQRRIVVMSYKSIINVIAQRHDHKLKEWQKFCEEAVKQLEHKELIPNKSPTSKQ